jgi:hypothetical protein
MSCRALVDGELATVRVRFADVELEELARSEGLYGQARDQFLTRLTREVRRALDRDDVDVADVSWTPTASIELAVVLTVAKLVIEVGSLLGALETIRRVVPDVARDGVAGWLGRSVVADPGRLEVGEGLLVAKVVQDADADPAPAQAAAAAGKTQPFDVSQLAGFAAIALATVGLTVLIVVLGVNALS